MTSRVASCRCGALQAVCSGEPVRVSVCHCRECQTRSGSAFAVQARWPEEDVAITGAFTEWWRTGESGTRTTFRFCPTCGSTIGFVGERMPGMIAIPVGAFADPGFPAPRISVYEGHMHPWVAIVGDDIERYD